MAASIKRTQVGPESLRSDKRGEGRPLVLVTDDDADTRELFRTMLALRGYAVIEASDGEQAVTLAESARPDLILMDARLPRLDGLSATRRIRESRRVGRVPIVFISGRAEESFRDVAREAGCDEFIVKPLSFDHLGGVVEKHLRKRSGC